MSGRERKIECLNELSPNSCALLRTHSLLCRKRAASPFLRGLSEIIGTRETNKE